MEIIQAKLNDFDTVRQITVQTIRHIYPHYYPAGAVDYFLAHHNDAAIRQDIAENRVFLCMTDHGEAAGTVTVCGNDIGRLFVLPEHQKKGFGKALLDFAEHRIAESYQTAELDVSFAAKAIYLKRGYTAVQWHTIRTENGDYLCFDHMVREL